MSNETKGFFNECVEDLTIPEGWSNESWSNDACPSYGINGLQIFIDHPDPAQRELGEDIERFSIILAKHYGEGEPPVFVSNDWHDVLSFVSKHG